MDAIGHTHRRMQSAPSYQRAGSPKLAAQVVEAPTSFAPGGCPQSALWYMFDPATSGCKPPRHELRKMMYGFGYSYAMHVRAERSRTQVLHTVSRCTSFTALAAPALALPVLAVPVHLHVLELVFTE